MKLTYQNVCFINQECNQYYLSTFLYVYVHLLLISRSDVTNLFLLKTNLIFYFLIKISVSWRGTFIIMPPTCSKGKKFPFQEISFFIFPSRIFFVWQMEKEMYKKMEWKENKIFFCFLIIINIPIERRAEVVLSYYVRYLVIARQLERRKRSIQYKTKSTFPKDVIVTSHPNLFSKQHSRGTLLSHIYLNKKYILESTSS